MEIYRSSQMAFLSLDVPVEIGPRLVGSGATNKIVAVENGKQIHEFTQVSFTGRALQVTLPWNLIREDRDFQVHWKFTYSDGGPSSVFEDVSYIQVVTPILSVDEIARITGWAQNDPALYQDIVDLERRVRYAVQSYTGQNFGRWTGQMQVAGNGSKTLQLPAPLLTYKGLAFDGILRSGYDVKVINGGWAITSGNIYIDNIKQAPPEWMLDRFDYVGKIHAPMLYGNTSFRDGVEYTIDGMWGYGDVPGDVQQAARLLVADYSCDESLWRDRYIDSIRAGEWRFEFNANAFAGTGNVQADQILEKYRRATMVVI